MHQKVDFQFCAFMKDALKKQILDILDVFILSFFSSPIPKYNYNSKIVIGWCLYKLIAASRFSNLLVQLIIYAYQDQFNTSAANNIQLEF